jgi:hypothetical protein
MGGESQKASLNQVTGYSTYAQFTGNPAYLEPNSQSMQKPVEGRSRIGCRINQNHDENHKTQPHLPNYIKRGYRLPRAQQHGQQNFFKTQHTIIIACKESSYANRENTRKKRYFIRLVQPLRRSTHQNPLKNAAIRRN